MNPYIGTVDALWRYPVKSMLGESCSSYKIETRGVEGDRLYAVRDEAGKLGSGKTNRRFTKLENLIHCRAHYHGGDTTVMIFPDGTEHAVHDSDIDHKLTQVLEQPVTLSRETSLSHFDTGPIHIVTTAAITAIRNDFPDMVVDERRFRPNLLLAVEGDTPVELEWVGKRLRIGSDIILEVSKPCARCVMTTLAQQELPREPRLLKHLADTYAMNFGVYANVIQGGTATLGDPVEIL